MSDADPKKKPRRPLEEVRAELMASAETQQLAQTLGIELKDYVEKVLAYYADPAKDAMIYLAPEEQLRAAGGNPPSDKEVLEYLQKVERGEIDLRPAHQKDGFSAAEKEKVAGLTGRPTGADLQSNPAGSALKDQVTRQVKKDQTPKG